MSKLMMEAAQKLQRKFAALTAERDLLQRQLNAAVKGLGRIDRAYKFPEVGCKPCGAAAELAASTLAAIEQLGEGK